MHRFQFISFHICVLSPETVHLHSSLRLSLKLLDPPSRFLLLPHFREAAPVFFDRFPSHPHLRLHKRVGNFANGFHITIMTALSPSPYRDQWVPGPTRITLTVLNKMQPPNRHRCNRLPHDCHLRRPEMTRRCQQTHTIGFIAK